MYYIRRLLTVCFQVLFSFPSPEVVSDLNYMSHTVLRVFFSLTGTLGYRFCLPSDVSHAPAVQVGKPQFGQGQKIVMDPNPSVKLYTF